MNKILTLALALAVTPLLAHDEGMMKDTSGTAKPMMKGKMKKMMKKQGAKAESKPKPATPDAKGTTVAAHKEHWVCPMGDGGESDHAGKCPKCGMDLVLEKGAKI